MAQDQRERGEGAAGNSDREASGNRGRQLTGRQGELLAADYLRKRGYCILDTNVRSRFGEMDIVAMDKQTLVFVEVRTRRGQAYGSAAESVTRRKQHKLQLLAEAYLAEHYGGKSDRGKRPARPSGNDLPPCRIDLVAITIGSSGAVEQIDLIRSAVEA